MTFIQIISTTFVFDYFFLSIHTMCIKFSNLNLFRSFFWYAKCKALTFHNWEVHFNWSNFHHQTLRVVFILETFLQHIHTHTILPFTTTVLCLCSYCSIVHILLFPKFVSSFKIRRIFFPFITSFLYLYCTFLLRLKIFFIYNFEEFPTFYKKCKYIGPYQLFTRTTRIELSSCWDSFVD